MRKVSLDPTPIRLFLIIRVHNIFGLGFVFGWLWLEVWHKYRHPWSIFPPFFFFKDDGSFKRGNRQVCGVDKTKSSHFPADTALAQEYEMHQASAHLCKTCDAPRNNVYAWLACCHLQTCDQESLLFWLASKALPPFLCLAKEKGAVLMSVCHMNRLKHSWHNFTRNLDCRIAFGSCLCRWKHSLRLHPHTNSWDNRYG